VEMEAATRWARRDGSLDLARRRLLLTFLRLFAMFLRRGASFLRLDLAFF